MIKDKKEIREQYIKKRLELTNRDISLKSKLIFQRIEGIDDLWQKTCFGAYLAVKNEVNTKILIDKLVSQKKEVYLPRFVERDKEYKFAKFSGWLELEEGYYGILQPKTEKCADIKKMEVIFMPGVAFDKRGVRLGWGTGTYDALLRGSKALKVGLCYDFQIADSLPYEEQDVKVEMVVSEKRVVRVDS